MADLAMEKMPVDTFGFYSLLEPYMSAYYEIGNDEKGRNLFNDVVRKFQENLIFLSGLSLENQEKYIEEIYTDIQRYRAMVDVLVVYDQEFALEETKKFNGYLRLFDALLGPALQDTEPRTDLDINDLLEDSDTTITPEEE